MIYIEKIHALKCPYCRKPKYANHPKVSIIIDKEGGRIFCEKCKTTKRAKSGMLGDALTEWVDLIGQDYQAIVENWAINLKIKEGDIDFFRHMRGFGDAYFRRYIELEIDNLDH